MRKFLALICVALLAACQDADFGERLVNADSETQNWLTHGRTYNEQRFSPLNGISDANVGELKLAWFHDFDTQRGQEATPIVIDGMMYTTSAWSKVQAFDAASGELLWQHDPEVPGETAVNACCDVVNRGVAVWNDKVYVASLDGRLIALNAQTGEEVWSTLTVNPDKAYTITGAPRVIKGKVLIGNGGGEYGVRGYFGAYDAETGEEVWRFYTVPGEPGKKDGAASDEILEKLAGPTWTGEHWKHGGGGTVWDSMAYDPELDLLYVGTGNGSPWNPAVRSPEGGDNLFLSSILALRPDTGEYVWHYQQVPGDQWDYTATQQMILAELPVEGEERKVIMQAPKNGFFYILDRETGELLSAEPFAPVNWATKVDLDTGRPEINPDAFYHKTGKPWLAMPGPLGAHSWHSMSYSQQTGLVYIPAQELGFPYIADTNFEPKKVGINLGIDLDAASLPEDAEVLKAIKAGVKGHLLAWDPVQQKEAWRFQHATAGNGGVLSTAGNLVFQGDAEANFNAFNATTGEKIWSFPAQTNIIAAPISYAIDGKQYVTIVVGWGGIYPLLTGEAGLNTKMRPPKGRVLTFALDGEATLPPEQELQTMIIEPPAQFGTAAMIAQGKSIYHRSCSGCHGDSVVSGGILPDLRNSGILASKDAWKSIVHDGALATNGMVGFGDDYSPEELDTVRAYAIDRASKR